MSNKNNLENVVKDYPENDVDVDGDDDFSENKTHQTLGQEFDLFFISDQAVGSPFILPNGKIIIQKLQDYFRNYYQLNNYQEVETPNLFNNSCFEKSGHADKYHENIFHINRIQHHTDDIEQLDLKPMNCPGDCLVFDHIKPSYSQLPIRIADFGILHRNESRGALRGLTRVRRFQQDDAHIFCRFDQVEHELESLINLMKTFYSYWGFSYKLELSTRPSEYIGDLDKWNTAEDILKKKLIEQFGALEDNKWELNIGDGAFYGPKIDFKIKDTQDRWHQCGTIQLDFNLPERFNLEYQGPNSKERPVLIHRAIMGSLERFLAIILEDTQGNLPYWFSPRQLYIVPVHQKLIDESPAYFEELKEVIYPTRIAWKGSLSYRVNYKLDDSELTMKKKIKLAYAKKYNYLLVIGRKEIEDKFVTLQQSTSKTETLKLSFSQLRDFLENERIY
jgi:threonyl-tRNA synthetase